MYSEAARARRRCTGRRKDGEPCQAWAVWDDPRQLCMAHAGRHHRGRMMRGLTRSHHARNPSCLCAAYQWPHRPGGGLCRWPDPPERMRTTPAGTHAPYPRGWVTIARMLEKRYRSEG